MRNTDRPDNMDKCYKKWSFLGMWNFARSFHLESHFRGINVTCEKEKKKTDLLRVPISDTVRVMEIESMAANTALIRAREGKTAFIWLDPDQGGEMWHTIWIKVYAKFKELNILVKNRYACKCLATRPSCFNDSSRRLVKCLQNIQINLDDWSPSHVMY